MSASPRANRKLNHDKAKRMFGLERICNSDQRERNLWSQNRSADGSARGTDMLLRDFWTATQTSLTTSKQHDACEFERAIIFLMNNKTPVADPIKISAIRRYFYVNLEHSCKPGWSQEMRRCALNGQLLASYQKLYEIIRDLKINKYDFLLYLKSYWNMLPADGGRCSSFAATISEKGHITIQPIKSRLIRPAAMDSTTKKSRPIAKTEPPTNNDQWRKHGNSRNPNFVGTGQMVITLQLLPFFTSGSPCSEAEYADLTVWWISTVNSGKMLG